MADRAPEAETLNAAADLVRTQRMVWVLYLASLLLFGVLAYRVHQALGGVGLDVWADAREFLYLGAAVSGVGALVLRVGAYRHVEDVHARALRDTVVVPGDTFSGTQRETLHEAVMALAERERVIWTLCVGPTVVAIPAVLLSGNAEPSVPLFAASALLLLATFPRHEKFGPRLPFE